MNPRLGRYWHLITCLVALIALALQLFLILAGQNVIEVSAAPGRGESVRRYFSYFTIQSNLLVAVSTFLIVRGRVDSGGFRWIRLASLVGIAVTGIVAAVLLPPSPSYSAANLLCDRLLHIVVPVLTVLGWVLFGPRGHVRPADLLPALVWPVLWLVATLGLGPVVHWYPYPFLDVARLGLARVLSNCGLIAVLFLGLEAAALWADGALDRAASPNRPGVRHDDPAAGGG